jgi:hypothetical protein
MDVDQRDMDQVLNHCGKPGRHSPMPHYEFTPLKGKIPDVLKRVKKLLPSGLDFKMLAS